MKKIYLAFLTFACCFLMTQYGYAQDDSCCGAPSAPAAEENACQPDRPVGDCYCLYRHDQPCCYTTWRCEYEPKYSCRRCCRYVPQYYQKTCCRYVPQYYCKTYCRQVPQYYYVTDCKYCKKYVPERHVKYVPRYYWKHTCNPAGVDSGVEQGQGFAGGCEQPQMQGQPELAAPQQGGCCR